jgi:hypothetical protein
MLAQEFVRIDDKLPANGGFTEVREGKYKEKKVAIKVLKVHVLNDFPSDVKKVRLL